MGADIAPEHTIQVMRHTSAGGKHCRSDINTNDVQGEVIEQQFGEKELCFRTLDLYTSAVLEASLNPTIPPKPEWRQAMDRMSEVYHLRSHVHFGQALALLL